MPQQLQLTVQPRLQSETWSLYWKESTRTFTDCLKPVSLSLDAEATTVANLMDQVSAAGDPQLPYPVLSVYSPYTVAFLPHPWTRITEPAACSCIGRVWNISVCRASKLHRTYADCWLHCTAAVLQVAAHAGWPPEDGLTSLPGFSGPWQRALCKGRVLQPTHTLQQAGLTDASVVTVVRIELVAEGWKVGGCALHVGTHSFAA
jgi:hypothetical protein